MSQTKIVFPVVITRSKHMNYITYLIHVVHSPRISSAWHSIFPNSCNKNKNMYWCCRLFCRNCVIIYTYLKIVICKCNNVHTGQDHALLQTFLKTTKLASISLSLIYLTMAIRYTTVHSFVLDSSLEKAFASMRKKKSYLGTLIFIILFR